MNKKYAIKEAKKLVGKYGPDMETINKRNFKNKLRMDVHKIANEEKIDIKPINFTNNISGVFVKKGGKLTIGINEEHLPTRQRFTIAHEIGHYKLHSEDVIHPDTGNLEKPETILFRANNNHGADELEANHFAAELLMPETSINKCIELGVETISDMINIFDVSEAAMRYRLINLGYL